MTPRETGAEIDSAAIGRALVSWGVCPLPDGGLRIGASTATDESFRHGWQEASF